MAKQKLAWSVCPWVTRKSVNDPLTPKQRTFLIRSGFPEIKLELLTKCEASALIEETFRKAGYTPKGAHRETLKIERLTYYKWDPDQLYYPIAWYNRGVFYVWQREFWYRR